MEFGKKRSSVNKRKLSFNSTHALVYFRAYDKQAHNSLQYYDIYMLIPSNIMLIAC